MLPHVNSWPEPEPSHRMNRQHKLQNPISISAYSYTANSAMQKRSLRVARLSSVGRTTPKRGTTSARPITSSVAMRKPLRPANRRCVTNPISNWLATIYDSLKRGRKRDLINLTSFRLLADYLLDSIQVKGGSAANPTFEDAA